MEAEATRSHRGQAGAGELALRGLCVIRELLLAGCSYGGA